MVNYMIAVDGSEHGEKAFAWALQTMNPSVDYMQLIIVAERRALSSFGFTYGYQLLADEDIQKVSQTKLLDYRTRARAQGVKCTALLSTAAHVGEALCQAARTEEADFLVVGSRGLGQLKSLFLGSVSKYCVENAPCNVIVVKLEPPKSEEHASKQAIVSLEEEERARRIGEEKARLRRERDASVLDRDIAVLAEEEERWRRVHEAEQLTPAERAERRKAYEQLRDVAKEAAAAGERKGVVLPPRDETHHMTLYKLIED